MCTLKNRYAHERHLSTSCAYRVPWSTFFVYDRDVREMGKNRKQRYASMLTETRYSSDTLALMLQEALNFDNNLTMEEFSPFTLGFRLIVNDCVNEMGFVSREEMIESLKNADSQELLNHIQRMHRQIKEKSQKNMERVVDLYYNGGMKDPSTRSFIQMILQKIRKGISSAENEIARIIAEILYGFVTLTALRI
jgi:hypothetical protein